MNERGTVAETYMFLVGDPRGNKLARRAVLTRMQTELKRKLTSRVRKESGQHLGERPRVDSFSSGSENDFENDLESELGS